jgi:hypothetical protein
MLILGFHTMAVSVSTYCHGSFMCVRCSCPSWNEIWHEVHKYVVDGSSRDEDWLSALVSTLSDVTSGIVSVLSVSVG